MPDSLLFISQSSLSAIANKIREILGGNTTYSVPTGMVNAIANCKRAGEDAMIQETIVSYNFDDDSYSFPRFRDYAFAGQTHLGSVRIHSNQAVLPAYCFMDCTGLTSVTCGVSGKYPLVVNRGVFKGCTGLQTISMAARPADITPTNIWRSIGDEAFSGCTSLSSVRFETGTVYYIGVGEESFLNCSSLTSYAFGTYMRSIGNNAFKGAGLTSLNINPSNTQENLVIGDYAFADCTDLETAAITKNFYPTTLGAHCFDGDTSLTSITLPAQLTAIPDYCFSGCTSLQSITIPASCRSIGNRAFEGCTSLTEVIFADTPTITSIGEYAFDGCSSLVNITIPDSVREMGRYAFRNCSVMEYIRMLSTTPPTAGTYMFQNTINNPLTIYVPDSENDAVLTAYRSATNWKLSSYANRMVAWSES